MSKSLPSRQAALKLLEISGCSNQVISHCVAVMQLAIDIAKECEKKGMNVDIQLVQIGALLHDIGRSKTHNINHVINGAEIAESFGLAKSIVSIIERHAGGITIDEARKLGWPIKNYLPQTIEEKIVTYSDKLIEGTRRVKIDRTIKRFSIELGSMHPSIKQLKKLHSELSGYIHGPKTP